MVDCEEATLQENMHLRSRTSERVDDNSTAIGTRLNTFKEETLRVIKHYDDISKLRVVSDR